jgi:SET domain-containing protein
LDSAASHASTSLIRWVVSRRAASRPFIVRRSRIHGRGVFATRRIRAGRELIAYEGQILTEAAVDARYGDDADDPHTLLFHVEGDRYIDASVGGNDARFINHSCDPNCESVVDDGAIVIRAIRNIQPGAELTYDYALEIEANPAKSRRALYACRCGAGRCRGTMLEDSTPRRRTRSRSGAG